MGSFLALHFFRMSFSQLSSFELLRCLDLIFDTSADPALLLPFLSLSANPDERLEAVLLCSRITKRDEDLVVALIRLLKSREHFASLIEPLVSALCHQFHGQEAHLANVLLQLDCLPGNANSQDMIYLASLHEHGIGQHLTISKLETMMSDVLWSSSNPGSALLAARAILLDESAFSSDAPMVKELLLGACNHSNTRIRCIARALLWESASNDNEILEKLVMSPPSSDAACQTVDLAGLVMLSDRCERYDLMLELLQRSHSSQQGRALLDAFVTHRISVNRAGSCILFAVSAQPQLLERVPPHPALRLALCQLLAIIKRAEAEEELSLAIIEEQQTEAIMSPKSQQAVIEWFDLVLQK